MSRRAARLSLLGLAVASLSLAGCVRGCPSSRPPIHLNPNMDDQPRAEAQAESEFFYDGKTMRDPVPGTVARGQLVEDASFVTGRDAAGAFLAASPVGATDALLARGEERFGIYCEPCHDRRGLGRGILFQRGKVPTTSLHDARVRSLGDGELFDVITAGKGLMPGYRWPIEPADRWAIVAHVRRLQREHAAAEVAAAAAPAPAAEATP